MRGIHQWLVDSPHKGPVMFWAGGGVSQYNSLVITQPIISKILTHWVQVMHISICISKLTIIGSDNGLLLGWLQAIIWTNDGILSTEPPGTNFSEILIRIHTFSFKKVHLKMSSGKWWPFCLGLNVLKRKRHPWEAMTLTSDKSDDFPMSESEFCLALFPGSLLTLYVLNFSEGA